MVSSKPLEEWFTDRRGRYADLIIAGRIFGGRHGESMQQPRVCNFDDSILWLEFAATEKLTVYNPADFQRGEFGQLIIPSATCAVFGWHYYGRDKAPENWCEETYELRDGWIQFRRTGPLMSGEEEFEYAGDRFIELL